MATRTEARFVGGSRVAMNLESESRSTALPPPARFHVLNGKRFSRLAFGTGRLGAFWQGQNVREQVRALHTALDSGINVIDTADVYARGLSERLVGRAIRGRRDEVILCTKVGQLKTPQAAIRAVLAEPWRGAALLRGAFPRRTPAQTDRVSRSYHPNYLRRAVAGSLRRMRTDYLDLLLLHSPPLVDLKRPSYWLAVEELLRSGRVRSFGVSCDSEEIARAAIAHEHVSYIELPIDPLAEGASDVLRDAEARGVGVLARSPFSGGRLAMLARRLAGGFDDEAAAAILHSVGTRPAVVTTVIGMSLVQHVVTNLRVTGLTASAPRTRELLRELRALARDGSC
jgi:aryl-alcohol dehydrogenase-like predicted oxidoreductase